MTVNRLLVNIKPAATITYKNDKIGKLKGVDKKSEKYRSQISRQLVGLLAPDPTVGTDRTICYHK